MDNDLTQICPNCGQSVSNDARFCTYCGTKIEHKPKPKFCPHCGEEVAGVYCPHCGYRINDNVEEQQDCDDPTLEVDGGEYTQPQEQEEIQNKDYVSSESSNVDPYLSDSLLDNNNDQLPIDILHQEPMDLFGIDQAPLPPMTKKERAELKRKFKKALRDNSKISKRVALENKAQLKTDTAKYNNVYKSLKKRDEKLDKVRKHRLQEIANSRQAQQFIPYEAMYQDGICDLGNGRFSQALEFSSVTYTSAPDKTQDAIIDAMGDIINALLPGDVLQFYITNVKLIDHVPAGHYYDVPSGSLSSVVEDLDHVISEKFREGTANMVRHRYIIFSVEADSVDDAARSLSRLRGSITDKLSLIGSVTTPLDGAARLETISNILRPEVSFTFDYTQDLSTSSSVTTKDYVTPSVLDFSKMYGPAYMSDDTWCQILVQEPGHGDQSNDEVISNILDLPIPMTVTWTLTGRDSSDAVDDLDKNIRWNEASIIAFQKKAIKGDYDPQMLPIPLKEQRETLIEMRNQLRQYGQHSFYCSIEIMTYAKSKEDLDMATDRITSRAHTNGLEFRPRPYQKRESLLSALPLAQSFFDKKNDGVIRDLYTLEAALLMPMTTISMSDENAPIYGQDASSHDLIAIDRKQAKPNGHAIVTGVSGSGKSMFVKREITQVDLRWPYDRKIIIDNTGEYGALTQILGGTNVVLGPGAHIKVDPLGKLIMADGEDPQKAIAAKVDVMIACADAAMSESTERLTQEQRSVIERSVTKLYRSSVDGTVTLDDFYSDISNESSHESNWADAASDIRAIFSRFVGDSSFAPASNADPVDLDQDLICLDFSQVPKDMRAFLMVSVLSASWDAMMRNFKDAKWTWLWVDEIQMLLSHAAVTDYLGRFWRETRKFGMICTGMTQSASALFIDENTSAIVHESAMTVLLRQEAQDAELWSQRLGLSKDQRDAIDRHASVGKALISVGAKRVIDDGSWPPGASYDLFNTSPSEAIAKANIERLRNTQSKTA